MTPIEHVLEIARTQAAAVARGDLQAATDQLDERTLLLDRALPARPADAGVIAEILRLDRGLSGAIREKMVELSNEVRESQRGRRALDSYGHGPGHRSRMVDAVG